MTVRQTEVLAAVARGLSNRQIAVDLGCPLDVVEAYINGLLRRSGCVGRGELLVALLAWPV